MATNHQVHRRSHEALLRKRRLQQESETDPVVEAGNQRRQLLDIDIPTFSDLFPPIRPERPTRKPKATSELEEETSTPILLPTSTSPIIPTLPTTTSTLAPIVPTTTSTIPTTASTSTTPIPVIVAPTTSSPRPAPAVPTTSSTPVPVVTITSYVRSGSARPSASDAAANGNVEPTGGSNAGAVAGGVIGGLLGLGALAAIVVFFIRRKKKRAAEEAFDPKDFRRSAMLMPESDTVPPPMMERQLPTTPNYGGSKDYGYNNEHMSPPSSEYGPTQGYHGSSYDDAPPGTNLAGMGSQGMAGVGSQQSWTPGQVIPMASHYAANPFMNPAPYNESPFSLIQVQTPMTPASAGTTHYPVGFPPSPARDNPPSPVEGQNQQAVLAQIGGAPILTRAASQKSNDDRAPDLSISVPANPSSPNVVAVNYPDTDADYVDLTRASVSPFQAAQYAEISKRLNTEVPVGIPSPMVEQYVKAQDRDLPPLPPPSPLAPSPSVMPSAPPPAVARNSVDSMSSIANAHTNLADFPIPPPSPATSSSKHRVDSVPPRLPEIAIQSRDSYNIGSAFDNVSSLGHGGSSNGHELTYDYHKSFSGPLSAGNIAPAFPSGVSAFGNAPGTPKEPSGLRQEVTLAEDLSKRDTSTWQLQRSPSLKAEIVAGKQKQRPETMYDPEDAYGGI